MPRICAEECLAILLQHLSSKLIQYQISSIILPKLKNKFSGPSGGTGRRARLKIVWEQSHESSSLSSATTFMINVTDLRNGTVYSEDDQLFEVLNYEHIKMGRGSANIKLKVRNLKNGSTIDKSYISGARVEEADLDKKKVQFLYSSGDEFTFMDGVSFDQFSLQKAQIDADIRLLKEGETYDLLTSEGTPLSLSFPRSLHFKIADADPGVKGDSVSNIMKDATLENGMKVRVPLFIKVGDTVKVDTKTGAYVERVKIS
jgi:elongation factor P